MGYVDVLREKYSICDFIIILYICNYMRLSFISNVGFVVVILIWDVEGELVSFLLFVGVW